MPYASHGSIALWYEDHGGRDAPVVVLVPGTGRQAIDSTILRVALTQAGYRVLAMDNRDAGLSTALLGVPANLPAVFAAAKSGTPTPSAYSADDMAGDILAVMDDARVARAYLVGRSLGGMAAQCCAIAASSRVAGFALIMTAARGLSELVTAERMQQLEAEPVPDAAGYAARQVAVARLNGLAQDFDPDRIEAEAKLAHQRGVHPGATARHFAVVIGMRDLRADLSRLTVPALLIHGALDRVVPPAFGREIAAAIAGARYLELADMAHDGAPRVQALWIEPILEHLRSAGCAPASHG